jgi:hypothetical protein
MKCGSVFFGIVAIVMIDYPLQSIDCGIYFVLVARKKQKTKLNFHTFLDLLPEVALRTLATGYVSISTQISGYLCTSRHLWSPDLISSIDPYLQSPYTTCELPAYVKKRSGSLIG